LPFLLGNDLITSKVKSLTEGEAGTWYVVTFAE